MFSKKCTILCVIFTERKKKSLHFQGFRVLKEKSGIHLARYLLYIQAKDASKFISGRDKNHGKIKIWTFRIKL